MNGARSVLSLSKYGRHKNLCICGKFLLVLLQNSDLYYLSENINKWNQHRLIGSPHTSNQNT